MAGPLQEIMSSPQVGLPKYRDNYPVMITFMKIQEKMKAMIDAPPTEELQDEGVEEEGANFEAQAIAVLIKRGRAAVLRGDVEKAREALKAGLKIDMANPELKNLMTMIKSASDMLAAR